MTAGRLAAESRDMSGLGRRAALLAVAVALGACGARPGRVLVLRMHGLEAGAVDVALSQGRLASLARLRLRGAYGRVEAGAESLDAALSNVLAAARGAGRRVVEAAGDGQGRWRGERPDLMLVRLEAGDLDSADRSVGTWLAALEGDTTLVVVPDGAMYLYGRAVRSAARLAAPTPSDLGRTLRAVLEIRGGELPAGRVLSEGVRVEADGGAAVQLEGARRAAERGDYAAASALLDEAERRAPESVLVWQYRANVAYLRGDRAGARRALERGLALDPGNLLLRTNLERLEAEARR